MATRVTTVFPSAARTATATSDRIKPPYGCQSMLLVIDATAETDTASVVFTLKGVDPLTGKTWTILESAAVTGIETRVLRVSPHLTASANLIAKDIVPPVMELLATHDDADSLTYSVTAHFG